SYIQVFLLINMIYIYFSYLLDSDKYYLFIIKFKIIYIYIVYYHLFLQFTTINLNHYFTTFYFFFADDRLLWRFWDSSSDDGCVAVRSFSVEDCIATRVRLLMFAMILLVGSTEVHRMWSPEARRR